MELAIAIALALAFGQGCNPQLERTSPGYTPNTVSHQCQPNNIDNPIWKQGRNSDG